MASQLRDFAVARFVKTPLLWRRSRGVCFPTCCDVAVTGCASRAPGRTAPTRRHQSNLGEELSRRRRRAGTRCTSAKRTSALPALSAQRRQVESHVSTPPQNSGARSSAGRSRLQ
ncbi:unnamed protein product, partial [Ectocarpus sp. 12 AP-2014]